MHYDPKKDIIVASDSSNLGLGEKRKQWPNKSNCTCIENLIGRWEKI